MRNALGAGLWLFLLAAGGHGQQTPAMAPDEIFYNGKIVTVDAAFRIAEAFAVKGEQLLAVGDNDAVKALAGPRTRLTDLRGHTVIPGMMDNHNHQYNAAMVEYRGVGLSGVKSLEEMFDRIRQAVAKSRPGEAIITTAGWTENGLAEKRAPTRQELDQIASDRVIVVMRARGTAYLNSAGLRAAGITRATDKIAGVPVPKNPDGEPSGQLRTPGMVNSVVPKIVPPPPMKEAQEMVVRMMQQQLAMGLTSIRELELKPYGMRVYQALRREGQLAQRISMGFDAVLDDWNRFDEMLQGLGVEPGFGDHWLRLDCLSEFALDTGAESWVREPNMEGGTGAMRITPEQLKQAMITINRHGWRPAIHLGGDRTLDAVLDAFEAADAESPIKEKRWIVEHAAMMHPDQMDRIARLGVLVSAQFQPYNGYEGSVRTFGKARADRLVPIREMLDHKVVVSTGSDWPGGTNNPFVNVYFYVTRKTERGSLAGVEQKISREQALRVATVNNAYMTFEEDVKGSLEPGKLADFLILSADVMTVPEEQILEIKPLATYVGGRKVYASQDGGF